jgi:hypothetical protein
MRNPLFLVDSLTTLARLPVAKPDFTLEQIFGQHGAVRTQVTVLVARTCGADIITDAGTPDHHDCIRAVRRAARQNRPAGPCRDAAGAPNRAFRTGSRMLLVANRLLSGKALHRVTRFAMGIPTSRRSAQRLTDKESDRYG